MNCDGVGWMKSLLVWLWYRTKTAWWKGRKLYSKNNACMLTVIKLRCKRSKFWAPSEGRDWTRGSSRSGDRWAWEEIIALRTSWIHDASPPVLCLLTNKHSPKESFVTQHLTWCCYLSFRCYDSDAIWKHRDTSAAQSQMNVEREVLPHMTTR